MELAALISLTGCEDRMGRKREADRYNKQAIALKLKLPKYKRQGRYNDAGLNCASARHCLLLPAIAVQH